MIRRIHGGTVRDLAAAQVILDLSAACALNNTVVSFWGLGLEAVEVTDDGCGISVEDMHILGERHCTSKITTDEDIYQVQTFGFRGEALHSLAALSEDLVVTSQTRTNSTGTGLRVNLKSKDTATRVACPSGTTVRLSGLLSSLPVRRAEWERNAKRHLARALWLVQSYILAVPNVRIRCIGCTNGKSSVYFASSGSNDASKAYAEAFKGEIKGSFQTASVETEAFTATLYFTREGRRSADRQFSFLNSRPCDLPRVMKKLNETFRNHSSDVIFPIFVLFISTNSRVDANLTPDKRQVSIPFEDSLITCLCQEFDQALTDKIEIPVKLAPIKASAPSDDQIPSSLFSKPDIRDCSHCTDVLPQAHVHVDVSLDNYAQILERSDFGRMQILGQFNHGFVLTKIEDATKGTRVFIVDQHASDERFRLESLQRDLSFTCQAMLVPIKVTTGLDDVMYIIDNQKAFSELGFVVRVQDDDDGRSISLLSSPFVAGIQLAESGIPLGKY
ncbi:Pms1 mismatch repair mutL [Paramicrosporidium saccamoebae]|uniref:Pms1 mismatch repair mutL n=1 Tax=Paramicrosporidium saccamoebae TaxID=1246581 RepID=A0A2H9TGJ7_9FUNG|nr:Pms1 mismatch repair mutL [Paramicrosporidium saccamoebae]